MADVDDIAAVLAGDRNRFRPLVTRHERAVLALVRAFVGDEGRCEDIAQETFVSAFTHLGRFDAGRGRFSTWLYAIARNKARDALRRPPPDVRAPAAERAARESGLDPESSDGRAFVRRALEVLPTSQRVAFLLADVFGLRHAEVAEIEGVAVGTIKSRVTRARDRLREVLQPEETR